MKRRLVVTTSSGKTESSILTGTIALGYISFLIFVRIDFQKIRILSTLIPPEVDPEQAH